MMGIFQLSCFSAVCCCRPDADTAPNLPIIILGAILGVALAGLLGWGIALLLGKTFVVRLGLLLLGGLFGLIGAVIADARSTPKRPLDAWEAEAARRVFGNSLDLSKVRIAYGSRLMTWPRRRMNRTPLNTMYLTKRFSNPQGKLECLLYEDVLIHELTHCWQTQHGIPFRKKLGTALRVIFNRKKPYRFGNLQLAWRDRKDFRDFNTEQQAAIITNYYCCKYHNFGGNSCACPEHYARQMKDFNGYAIPDSIP